MQTKRDAIARFIHVIKPLAGIFRLSMSHIHIFCDREGGVIAMNRNGGIFLNLRYFEQWRTYFVVAAELSPEYCLLFRRCQCQQRRIDECLHLLVRFLLKLKTEPLS